MSNYSQTFADGTREVRTELYDGTAEVVQYSSNGTITSTAVIVSDAVLQEETPSAQVVAAQAIHDEISSRVDQALTIGELKLAITEGLNAALAQLQG
jgi:hypothetical protein